MNVQNSICIRSVELSLHLYVPVTFPGTQTDNGHLVVKGDIQFPFSFQIFMLSTCQMCFLQIENISFKFPWVSIDCFSIDWAV